MTKNALEVPDLLHILSLYPIEPQHLRIALVVRFLLRLQAGGIVAAYLYAARSVPWCCSDIFVLDKDLGRRQTALIIRALPVKE